MRKVVSIESDLESNTVRPASVRIDVVDFFVNQYGTYSSFIFQRSVCGASESDDEQT